MSMKIAHQAFAAETDELLHDMESGILVLEKEPANEEAIATVFRAAHTIKGSAGVLGFNNIVKFTHVVESLLEVIRSGDITVNDDLVELLLRCKDHINTLTELDVSEDQEMDDQTREIDDALVAALKMYVDVQDLVTEESRMIDEEGGADEEIEASDEYVQNECWHLSIRFGVDVLRHGMDPFSFIRYLHTLGKIVRINTLWSSMPHHTEMDPESCYMGLEIDFYGDVSKPALMDVFSFVADDCEIHILPPHSKICDYIALINELPEDNMKLGELLVFVGALTQNELEIGLRCQEEWRRVHADNPEKREGKEGKIGEILIDNGDVQRDVVDAALKKQNVAKEKEGGSAYKSSMRVSTDKVDELVDLVGELVIAGSASRLLSQQSGMSDLIEASSHLERLVEQVRDSALRLRMVPIGETFNKFNRVVRDTMKDLDKDVELVIRGGETELDKSLVDKISDPLMHLVRNAIDHGICHPDERISLGKSKTGTVTLSAYHKSGSIVIEVSDDGRGLDKEKILSKAIEKRLIPNGHELTDEQIYELIMEAGFSTADEVTNISGRGVGMDVVRRNIEALRGSIEIDSKPGHGTTFSISLPLSLAIIDGFVMGVGRSSYVVPLDTVVECIEYPADANAIRQKEKFINLRDEVLPLLHLGDLFGETESTSKRRNIVVVSKQGHQAGLVVDRLLGELQTVIKPLGRLFEHLSGVSGSSILGSGEVALVLDVATLIQKIINTEKSTFKKHLPQQSEVNTRH